MRSIEDWSTKKFLSKITQLPPENEHRVKCEGGVLYLYEAKSEKEAQSKFIQIKLISTKRVNAQYHHVTTCYIC